MCENFPRVKKEHRRRRASPCAIYSLIYYFSCRSRPIHTRNFPGGFPVGSVSVSTAKLRPPRTDSLVSRGTGEMNRHAVASKNLRNYDVDDLAGMVNDNIGIARFSREETMTRVLDIGMETLQTYKVMLNEITLWKTFNNKRRERYRDGARVIMLFYSTPRAMLRSNSVNWFAGELAC